jgi:L-ascorbate metabolism protein UlaG (beta-lactamase superfamily)
MEIKFLGHAAFALSHDGKTVLVDPFLTGNPKAAVSADEVEADAIFLTHGHGDHLGDTVAIAKRTGADVVAIVELAAELGESGVAEDKLHDPNIGGTVDLGWASVRLTPAWHTGTSPSGGTSTPAGLVIEIGGKRIYHLGDTGLFSDLALPSRRGHIDVAIIPIGGHYTMDRFDAVTAAEFVKADQVIPCHYDTFPPIETDAQAYKSDVQNAGYAEVIVLAPGETHTVR